VVTVPEAVSVSAEQVLEVSECLASRVSLRESLLLQRFAVDLINAHESADKIPIFLV
jgi:hypothetical protein